MSPQSPSISVIVSTHEHALLLPLAVGSVLAQRDADLEVLICGDGMTDATREVARGLARIDSRVRVLDLPKAPRVGEENRNRAVAEAAGKYVLYQADDDLWLADHARTLAALLEAGAELAIGLTVVALADGTTRLVPHDYTEDGYRSLLESEIGRVSLAAIGHRRADYGSGIPPWRTTEGTPSDLDFTRAYLRAGGTSIVSATEPTVLLLPSPQREGMDEGERERELRDWWARASAGGLAETGSWRRAALQQDVRAEHATRAAARVAKQVAQLTARAERLESLLTERDERIARLGAQLADRKRAIERTRGRLEEQRETIERLRRR